MRKLLVLLALISLTLPSVAFAGRTVWVSSNHIQVIDVDAGKVVGRIPLQEFIHDMEFSVDGASAYVASSHGLRVADADKLEFVQVVDQRPTSAVSVSADGLRVAAIHRADSESSQAARLAGLPLPASSVVVYSALGMAAEHSFPVSGNALDVMLSPDGSTVFVLVPHDGNVYVHNLDGQLVETIELVDQGEEHGAMLSRIAMAPDGSRLVVSVTDRDQSWLADVDLASERSAEDKVLRQDLGHARRVQGLAWDVDGSGVYVSAVRSIVKFDRIGLPVKAQVFPVNYVDVEPLRGDEAVVITPTFSERSGTGGVSLLDGDGSVLRTIELPDMSPFVVSARP